MPTLYFPFLANGHSNYSIYDRNNNSVTKDRALRSTRLHILSSKEFNYQACLRRLEEQRLPSEMHKNDGSQEQPQIYNQEEHYILIRSLIDFSSECMVRAAGALLNFLDKYQIGGPNLDARGSQTSGSLIFAIRSFFPEEYVGKYSYINICHKAGNNNIYKRDL